jgi:hypothetical protein
LVVSAGRLNRWWYGHPESGAHIDSLSEGQYHVVYWDGDGHEWPIALVTARRQDVVPAQRWQWAYDERHNNGSQPTVDAPSSRAAGG